MAREINYFMLTGELTKIGEIITIDRKNVPTLYKRMLTIKTVDDQVLYPEIRNVRLKKLDQNEIEEGDLVEIEYSFEGSEKNGKIYNNIFLNKITKL